MQHFARTVLRTLDQKRDRLPSPPTIARATSPQTRERREPHHSVRSNMLVCRSARQQLAAQGWSILRVILPIWGQPAGHANGLRSHGRKGSGRSTGTESWNRPEPGIVAQSEQDYGPEQRRDGVELLIVGDSEERELRPRQGQDAVSEHLVGPNTGEKFCSIFLCVHGSLRTARFGIWHLGQSSESLSNDLSVRLSRLARNRNELISSRVGSPIWYGAVAQRSSTCETGALQGEWPHRRWLSIHVSSIRSLECGLAGLRTSCAQVLRGKVRTNHKCGGQSLCDQALNIWEYGKPETEPTREV